MKKGGALKRSVHRISIKAEKALKEAVAKMIREYARTGDSIVIWRNGKVVQVPASQLLRRKK